MSNGCSTFSSLSRNRLRGDGVPGVNSCTDDSDGDGEF